MSKDSVKDKRLVRVMWADSYSHDSGSPWVAMEDLTEVHSLICESVGWIWQENDDSITLVSHVAEIEVAGDITIPKVAIKSIVDLVQQHTLTVEEVQAIHIPHPMIPVGANSGG